MADLQRQQARKKRGSIRYKRLGKQVAKVHERIGNLRREFLHKTTTRMVKSCAVIATEELRVNNMSLRPPARRAILAGWSSKRPD
ncbi:MAG: putative transposase [Caballeronia sp.]|nr:putative transposase [Caballeronia sp.]